MICPYCGEDTDVFLEEEAQEQELERKRQKFEEVYSGTLGLLRRKVKIKGAVVGLVAGIVFMFPIILMVTGIPRNVSFPFVFFPALGALIGAFIGIDVATDLGITTEEELRLFESFNPDESHDTASK